MTRCKIGTIAYIRKCSNPHNLRLWVEVVQATQMVSQPDVAAWIVRRLSDKQLLCYRLDSGYTLTDEAKCPDEWLRPVDSDSTELDETHTWRCGSPGQMLAHGLGGA